MAVHAPDLEQVLVDEHAHARLLVKEESQAGHRAAVRAEELPKVRVAREGEAAAADPGGERLGRKALLRGHEEEPAAPA